jgi:hypothetical protein
MFSRLYATIGGQKVDLKHFASRNNDNTPNTVIKGVSSGIEWERKTITTPTLVTGSNYIYQEHEVEMIVPKIFFADTDPELDGTLLFGFEVMLNSEDEGGGVGDLKITAEGLCPRVPTIAPTLKTCDSTELVVTESLESNLGAMPNAIIVRSISELEVKFNVKQTFVPTGAVFGGIDYIDSRTNESQCDRWLNAPYNAEYAENTVRWIVIMLQGCPFS